MKAMRRYSLYQGEGVIVSYKKIGAITTQLYSCMGIVMINPKTHRAGLYHYSAETLHKGEVQESIRQMINDLVPERIIVTPAKATWGPESGSLPHDLKAVVSFLAGAWKKPEVGEPHGMSGFSWENDALLVNEGVEDSNATRDGMEQLAGSFDWLGGRQMNADAWYYGVKMERSS